MSEQFNLFNGHDENDIKRMVHTDDPITSFIAADGILPKVSKLQSMVLDAHRTHGPMIDEELVALPCFHGYAYSTVRTRRGELVRKGFIRSVGIKLNAGGRPSTIWEATSSPGNSGKSSDGDGTTS